MSIFYAYKWFSDVLNNQSGDDSISFSKFKSLAVSEERKQIIEMT